MRRIAPIVKFPALAALLALSTMLAGCDDSTDSASTAVTPASATSTTPTDTATSTTTATAINGAVTLTWVAPTENTNGQSVTDLAGYYIYYGTEQSDLSQLIPVSGADTTTFVVNGLGSGTYYFAVSAYNTMGTDSAESNIVSVTI
jgi:CTP-dependent riboflavin kinase